MAQAALTGAVSAIPAIFYAKARYGWRESDKEAGVVDNSVDEMDADEIMERYSDLPN